MPTSPPVLSIVIPAYNEAEELPNLLRSLAPLASDPAVEIIVVDNGSTDSTSKLAIDAGANVVQIARSSVGRGRNTGVQVASGNLLAFLDADVVVTPEWIAEVRVWMAAGARTGIIAGDVYDVVDNASWIEKFWFGAMYRRGAIRYINGGNMLLRREDFDGTGGFDETMMSGEDVDFCEKAKAVGLEIHPDRSFRVLHAGYPSNVRGFIGREAWHGRGDFKSLSAVSSSPVAKLTLVFLAAHVLGVALVARGAWIGLAIVVATVATACLCCSWAKWRREPPKIVLVNAGVFYLYFIGRSLALMHELVARFPVKWSGGRPGTESEKCGEVTAGWPLRRRPLEEQKTKVLIVCSTLHIGGAERIAANLSKSMPRDQFDVSAAVLKANGVVGDDMVRDGVELIRLDRSQGRPDYLTSLKLMRLICRRRFDIVHTHDTHGLVDASLCRLLGGRFKHVHTLHFGNYPNRDVNSKRIERIFWRVPDRLIAVGHRQRQAIARTYGIPLNRMEVIWNGVAAETPLADVRVTERIERARGPIIASISTLIPQKGVEVLLRAAALLMSRQFDFDLLIAGDGKLREGLQRLTMDLCLEERVCFLGWVPEASRSVLPHCDVFVQASLWEAMSVVVLEAMAAAKAMVVTDVGENPRMVVDNVSAMIVPPGDAAALADKLGRLLGDPALRGRLGHMAQARYREQFSLEAMLLRHALVYERLAAKANRRA